MAACSAQERRLAVLPIVGIGGLGKTTLAQLIYNDERVQKSFELKLWVCVSEVFDLKEVIKKIIMSSTNSESQNLEIDQLQGQLRNEISGKKYFLVLDDVWNDKREEWLNLSELLEVGGAGSMILVTTRLREVADIMGTLPAYDLGSLSEDKSCSLFEKMAFEPGESQKKPQLVELGKEIVKKCGNVPLALITLGTFLREREEGEWVSIGKLRDGQNNMMHILKLSYQHLLSPLKNCFAYCALFPKDYIFDKECLVDLWMAEGFVAPAYETQNLKELGDEYLMILLQSYFFRDVTRDEFGSISSFKMHNLMHDLALDVAGAGSKAVKLHDRNLSERVRHLSFDYRLTSLWEIPSFMLKAKHLRTFLLPHQLRDGSDFNKAVPVLQQLISSFRCLRVLDLRSRGLTTLPKSIGKLIHLRYLNLSWNPIKELPNSITKLQNLQTLILCDIYSLRALPIHTRKLTNLMSLDIQGCYELTHMPSGLGELTSLHKLPYFVVKSRSSPRLMCNPASAQLRDLKTLNNLMGSLKIELRGELEDPASEAKEANLISKHGLTKLCISMIHIPKFEDDSGSNHDEVILEGLKPHGNLKKLEIYRYRGQVLPSWAISDTLCMTLPNLVKIHLEGFEKCTRVPCFSQLPFLKRLTLENLKKVEFMEKSVHEVDSATPPSTRTFFPSLQELELCGMDNLKSWWEETDVVAENISHSSTQFRPPSQSFCGLIKLRISNCECLESFPVSPNVEELNLKQVNKNLTVLKKLKALKSLRELRICLVEKLEHLPSGLQHLTNLRLLKLSDNYNLTEVPKWIGCLSSLRSLELTYCDKLKCLPEEMRKLTSLNELKIEDCPGLTKRCRDPDGDDYPHIQHIKHRTVVGSEH